MKSKAGEDEDVELKTDLDDGYKSFKVGFKIYMPIDGIIHTSIIAGYNSRDRMYHIKYKNGDKEHLFHNKVHSYRDKIDPCEKKKYLEPTKPKLRLEPTLKPIKFKKKRDIRRKYRT